MTQRTIVVLVDITTVLCVRYAIVVVAKSTKGIRRSMTRKHFDDDDELELSLMAQHEDEANAAMEAQDMANEMEWKELDNEARLGGCDCE